MEPRHQQGIDAAQICRQSTLASWLRATLISMKAIRLFVLVLLAMLLPLRGVSAASLLCEQQPVSHGEVMVHAHGHEAANAASHEHSQHEHAGADKGRHCLSSCSAAPLMATAPSVAMPVLIGTAVFPHFAAPAPAFESEGLERPPRST
ncbi:MAG TPA: hypothetical protein VFL86_28745 [Burkholderiaceae bacterium]|nr:hypothetical protein [Burkholderiaceae bacterium]